MAAPASELPMLPAVPPTATDQEVLTCIRKQFINSDKSNRTKLATSVINLVHNLSFGSLKEAEITFHFGSNLNHLFNYSLQSSALSFAPFHLTFVSSITTFPLVLSKEYCMIYRGPGFLAVV